MTNYGISPGIVSSQPVVPFPWEQRFIEPTPNVWFQFFAGGGGQNTSLTLFQVQGFTLNSPAVLTDVRCECVVAGAGTAQYGLYGTNTAVNDKVYNPQGFPIGGYGSPGQLLWRAEVGVSTLGKKTAVANLPLQAGTYWIGVGADTVGCQFRGGQITPVRSRGAATNIVRNGPYVYDRPSGVLLSNPRWYVSNGQAAFNIELRFA